MNHPFNQLVRGKQAADETPKPPYEYQEFPKGMHHPTENMRIVQTPEQAEALREQGWFDSPCDFPEQPAQAEAKPTGETEMLNAIAKLEAEKTELVGQLEVAKALQAEAVTKSEHLEGAVADLKKQLKAATTAAKKPADTK